MESLEPQLRGIRAPGRWSGRAVSDMLGVGAAATWDLVTLSCSLYPLILTLPDSVGVPVAPLQLKYSRRYPRAPHEELKCRSRRVHKALPRTRPVRSPLPWGEVGFTHTDNLVPPKSHRLESWPFSTLSCTSDFLPALICSGVCPFFLPSFHPSFLPSVLPPFLPAMRLATTSFPPKSLSSPLLASTNAITSSLEGKGVRTLPTLPSGEAQPDGACACRLLSADPQSSRLRRSSIG